jgi:urease accessory protein UreF
MLDTLTPLMDNELLHDFAQAVKKGRGDGNAAVVFGIVSALWDIPLRAGGIS